MHFAQDVTRSSQVLRHRIYDALPVILSRFDVIRLNSQSVSILK